jgi:hypothetical protein
MNDTPRTNEIAALYDAGKTGPAEIICFARQLEAELVAALQRELAVMREDEVAEWYANGKVTDEELAARGGGK